MRLDSYIGATVWEIGWKTPLFYGRESGAENSKHIVDERRFVILDSHQLSRIGNPYTNPDGARRNERIALV